MDNEKSLLRKLIKYRISYSGMKETDIVYQRLIAKKLDNLNLNELKLLSVLFTEISDSDIFNMLTNQIPKKEKFKDLINKILNE